MSSTASATHSDHSHGSHSRERPDHTHGHDYAGENKKHFDTKAEEVDAIPEFRTLGRDVGASLLRTYPALFDPTATELLDFACGTGLVSFEIAPHVKSLLGVDISSGMVDRFSARAAGLGIAPTKTHAIATELTGSGGELGGAKFDVVLVRLIPGAATRLVRRYLAPLVLAQLRKPSPHVCLLYCISCLSRRSAVLVYRVLSAQPPLHSALYSPSFGPLYLSCRRDSRFHLGLEDTLGALTDATL
ncbi:uncharacterized protein PHACADRAFT_187557 [Phanerochaete carnosa HHB-10118-sp]|uniref:Methyltransferase domain-containing protein n=1 Tax=Phanerochaete carnosa (strain HHB-10118-sp) TaxID=650164 RepID=K5VVT2_PHACS|nr:uncharacterized protein PHACADRAFT_187557 [Phanerochaete carnosa HHB-10118-sp]EKM50910.1 hypothetical protein PHACADRAFT_187557 [Phanerochaete carnosa HHB-10118-sp]